MGSCRSIDCDKITKSVGNWAIKRTLWLSSEHEESRKTELRFEWKLNRTIFHNMLGYFSITQIIDLFASRVNTQLLRVFSYRSDPFAEVTNAFLVSWENKKFYCFPPFVCIGKILQKICADKATGLLVVANWPTQIWSPFLMDMLISESLIIPPSINQLELSNNMKETHPLWQRLELMGCMVSGKGM